MSVFNNEVGVPFTAANASAVQHFDRTIRAYATFRRDIGACLKDTFAADPDMVMAHVLKGCFFLYMGLPAVLPKAEKCLTDAQARLHGATARERLHVAALAHWCELDYEGALAIWERILLEHPRDFLALKLANYHHFYLGDSANVRDSVARVAYAWEPSDPGYGLVMSLAAFGLEETGAYAEAERLARESVKRDPLDGWGIHTVAHVLESQDRNREGIDWLRDLESHWDAGNNFRYHLWWHRALFHLDLEQYDQTLELYDQKLWDAKSDEYLDLCNDASLLLRLELAGVDVGARWQPLFDKVKDRAEDHLFCFVDAHFAVIHAAAGAFHADTLLASLRAFMRRATRTTAAVTERVGYALAEAIGAYAAKDYAKAVDLLEPLRYRIEAIGGSVTQREVFTRLLIEASIRAQRYALARALLSERLRRRPDNGWMRRAWSRIARDLP